MNINFGLRHLLLWQTYHFCNWISAVPLEKPTIPSNSVENSSETKGDLFTDKHIEKPATINGNYSAVVTITTLKTFSLPIQANDAKQTPSFLMSYQQLNGPQIIQTLTLRIMEIKAHS